MSIITFYLSGGIANLKTSQSLGGSPSNQVVVTSSVDNLFSQVKKTEYKEGSTVYRCIYIFNEGLETVNNLRVSLTESDENISSLYFGLPIINEIQKIVLSGEPFGGTFTIRYKIIIDGVTYQQDTNPITFSPTPEIMSSNIENALNDLDYLSEVVVSSEFIDSWIYTITFTGENGGRNQELLEISNNSIIGLNISFDVGIETEGYPINSTAVNIGFENQLPFGVTFTSDTVTVGDLYPADRFPLWLKRVTSSDSSGTIDSAIVQITIEE